MTSFLWKGILLKEFFLIKNADSPAHGTFVEINVAVKPLSYCISQPHKLNPIHLHCIGVAAEICQTDITELSAWLYMASGNQETDLLL